MTTDAPDTRVSIILPYYNGSAFMAETVDSVLAQTHRAFELLVIDDGSSDAETTWLTGFLAKRNDDRIVYHRKPNGGLSDARNYGVKAASSELICLLDQDDVWEPEKLARQVSVMDRHPDVHVVVVDGSFFGNVSGEFGVSRITGGRAQILPASFARMLRANFVIASGIMYRKSVVATVGEFSKRYFVAPDYEYFIRLSEKFDFFVIPELLIRYRFHGANTTRAKFRLCGETITIVGERKLKTRREKYEATRQVGEVLTRIAYNWVKGLWV
jgi:glycosyltransferase involved in cell wall biosynthesis